MSQATYTHVGDPSGTPTDDLLFTAKSSGSAGNLASVSITSTTDSGVVGITVTGTEIAVVALRSGGDSTHADSTYLTSIAAALNANALVAALVDVSVLNTTPGATLWATVSGPVLLSGGTPIEAEAEITVDITPDPENTATVTMIQGISCAIAPGIAMTGEASIIYGPGGKIDPSILFTATLWNILTAGAPITVTATMTVDARADKALAGLIYPSISMTASASLIRPSLTVCDVVRDILMQWGLEIPCSAPQFSKISAINTINQAMQMVWNRAKDRNYWTRQTVSVTYPADAVSYELSDSVQNIIGHVRLDGRPLVPLGSRYEAEHFDELFGEDTTNPPTAYFADRLNQAGSEPCKVTLMLVPPPAEEKTVSVDAVMECTRYTVLDLDSCPLVPIPHKYVESLLMPVARYLSMQSHLFINEANRDAIVAAYQAALGGMDDADPLVAPARQQKGGDQ